MKSGSRRNRNLPGGRHRCAMVASMKSGSRRNRNQDRAALLIEFWAEASMKSGSRRNRNRRCRWLRGRRPRCLNEERFPEEPQQG